MKSDQQPDGLVNKALTAIRRESLLAAGDIVLVALSGGADSMALLHTLLLLKEPLGLTGIEAVHVHHGLRGEEADRDEEFVRAACRRLSVPLVVMHTDVREQAAKAGEGLEETGRRIRYACFARLAGEKGAVVATAHTLSDNMETILLHLTRGCGLRGLCGIPAKRPLLSGAEEAENVRVIRPLIGCSRREIEEFCRNRQIGFVTDSTNREEEYARNRIRLQVIPELEKLNPALPAAFARMIKRVRQDAAYLEDQADKALRIAKRADEPGGYDRKQLRALPPALRSRVLGMIAAGAGSDFTEAQVETMERLLETGGSVFLTGGIRVCVGRDRLRVLALPDKETVEIPREMRIEPGNSFAFYGRITMPRLLPLAEYEKESKIHKNLLKNALNYDKISGYVSVRSRRPGDVYHPVGRGVGKTLKKLFNEAGIPAEERERVPVFCDRQGIVLVAGFGCDERVRVCPDTRQVLVLGPLKENGKADGETQPLERIGMERGNEG